MIADADSTVEHPASPEDVSDREDGIQSSALVSIVLPTYNGARYLAESIESVLRQTYSNWELIIVDDCSTDETPRIIEDFAKRNARIRAIRNPKNKRLPASLNVGFAEAKGKYFTWTSDDNLYRPDAIRQMLKYLIDHESVGLVYCDMTLIDSTGASYGKYPTDGPEQLLTRNVVGACFLYTRSAAIRTGDYDSRFTLAEDYDYWLRVSTHYPIAWLRADLYEYRMHEASLTSTRRRNEILGAADRAVLRSLSRMSWADRVVKQVAFRKIVRRALERGEYGMCARAAFEFTCRHPISAGSVAGRALGRRLSGIARIGGHRAEKCDLT